ncbi:hypothetical protein, partial [Escherichia coli]|uniref:hypothetical protein n=1 Tax=Escherichia coli TaxID=562 RepID=UPI00098B0966
TGGTADRNRSHWSTSKTPSYTKSVSWQHHRLKREYHIAEARYWRKAGDKSKKQLCLWQAQRERMNEREFLSTPSELPF